MRPIDGTRDKRHAAQSGRWIGEAVSSGGGTTFKMAWSAALTEWMVGWYLQPNVSRQVYLPITAVNVPGRTVTVAGDYASLSDIGTQGSFKGTRFRIYAPPGVVTGRKVAGVGTNGAGAGALSRWTSAGSSRHLYAGYRYESPLAGLYYYSSSIVKYRQSGKNFAGVRAANAPERRNAPQGKLHAVPALRPRADALHQPRPGRQPLLQPPPLRREQPGAVLRPGWVGS